MSIFPQSTLCNDHCATHIAKILLLGQSNVGKTSLVTRYADNKFCAKNTLLTVGVDIKKVTRVIKGKTLRLQLWDTAGQQKYKTAIPSIYFKNVQGVILVYDISDQQSFQRVSQWITKIQDNCDSNNLVFMLVGNKLDLNSMREVTESQALKFSKQNNMKFKQTSAKQGINVSQMIQEIMNNQGIKGNKFGTQQKIKAILILLLILSILIMILGQFTFFNYV